MLVVCMCNITFDSMTRSHQYSMCPEKSKYPFEICCSAHSLSRELLPQWRSLHPGSAPWLPSSRKMAHFGCLDPTDLNQAIQQEHYPLSTIEDVATLLHEAKIFTILDVCKGLLQTSPRPSLLYPSVGITGNTCHLASAQLSSIGNGSISQQIPPYVTYCRVGLGPLLKIADSAVGRRAALQPIVTSYHLQLVVQPSNGSQPSNVMHLKLG